MEKAVACVPEQAERVALGEGAGTPYHWMGDQRAEQRAERNEDEGVAELSVNLEEEQWVARRAHQHIEVGRHARERPQDESRPKQPRPSDYAGCRGADCALTQRVH